MFNLLARTWNTNFYQNLSRHLYMCIYCTMINLQTQSAQGVCSVLSVSCFANRGSPCFDLGAGVVPLLLPSLLRVHQYRLVSSGPDRCLRNRTQLVTSTGAELPQSHLLLFGAFDVPLQPFSRSLHAQPLSQTPLFPHVAPVASVHFMNRQVDRGRPIASVA